MTILMEFASRANAAIQAASAAYDAALHARRVPDLPTCASAVSGAVGAWSPIVKGRSPITPALRAKLVDALAHLGHNLRACQSGGDEYPLI
jgi:hypothetical protein